MFKLEKGKSKANHLNHHHKTLQIKYQFIINVRRWEENKILKSIKEKMKKNRKINKPKTGSLKCIEKINKQLHNDPDKKRIHTLLISGIIEEIRL